MPQSSPRRPWLALLAACAWAVPGGALAGSVAVPPLVSSGVDAKQTYNLTSLIASELDFMSEFEGATQLSSPPAGFNGSCTASGSCLGKVAAGAGSSATVAGAVSKKGENLDFFLVYADGSKIVRNAEFSLPNSPSAVADGLTSKIRELVTGQTPKAAAAAASGTVSDDAFDGYEEDEFVMAAGVSRRIPTSSGNRSTELDDFDPDAEDRRAAEEQARREEEERARVAAVEAQQRQAAEERRQREVEEEERRRAAVLVARQQDEEPEEDDFEDFDLSFGGGVVSVDEASSAREEEDRRAAAVAPLPRQNNTREQPSRSSSSRAGYDDLDGPSERDQSPRESQSRDSRDSRDSRSGGGSTRDSSDDVTARVTVTGRVGYSRFQALNFATYGAELGVLPTENLTILAGVEGYSTRRVVPLELQELGYPPYTWNSILPLNFGAVYMFSGRIRPYVGGDVIVIPGLVQGQQGVATGLRLRGGANFFFTDSLGFNLNAAAGFLTGKTLEAVNPDVETSGFTPQINMGLVLAL